jgi:hypothetical protein
VLTLFIALTAVAHAQFAEKTSGPYLDVAGGLGMGDAPMAAGPGWMGGLGWWFGRYDEAYAIGRYTSIGATLRQDWVHLSHKTGATVRTAPMLEIRRGNDLIVAGVSGFVAGGPVIVQTPQRRTLDYTARAGIGAEFRRHRFWGLTLRLEGGADIGDQVSGVFSTLVGVQFSRPAKTVK